MNKIRTPKHETQLAEHAKKKELKNTLNSNMPNGTVGLMDLFETDCLLTELRNTSNLGMPNGTIGVMEQKRTLGTQLMEPKKNSRTHRICIGPMAFKRTLEHIEEHKWNNGTTDVTLMEQSGTH